MLSSSEEDIGPQGLLFSDERERARRLSRRQQQSVTSRNREAIASWLAETKRESLQFVEQEMMTGPLTKSESAEGLLPGSDSDSETKTQDEFAIERGTAETRKVWPKESIGVRLSPSPSQSSHEERVNRVDAAHIEAQRPEVNDFATTLSQAVLAEAIGSCCGEGFRVGSQSAAFLVICEAAVHGWFRF